MNGKELRQLDFQVAEKVFGWVRGTRWGNGNGEWIIDGKTYKEHRISWDQTSRYSTDIAAAMRVEDRIAELGKQNDYIAHLWDEVGAAREGSNFWTAQNFNAFWLCVHATPEQRCRAALKATECLSINNHSSDGQAPET